MLRREYVTHVGRMFELLGDDSTAARQRRDRHGPRDRAGRSLAQARGPARSRANYNAMSVDAVSKLPRRSTGDFLEQANIRGLDSVVVGQPEFFRQVEKSLRTHSLEEWKTYLRWHLVDTFATRRAGSSTSRTSISSAPSSTHARAAPALKRMLDAEENYLGDALGQLYVQQYFSRAPRRATRSSPTTSSPPSARASGRSTG